MSTDAIVLLKQDHKELRRVFTEFEKLGDSADKTRGRLVDKMIETKKKAPRKPSQPSALKKTLDAIVS